MKVTHNKKEVEAPSTAELVLSSNGGDRALVLVWDGDELRVKPVLLRPNRETGEVCVETTQVPIGMCSVGGMNLLVDGITVGCAKAIALDVPAQNQETTARPVGRLMRQIRREKSYVRDPKLTQRAIASYTRLVDVGRVEPQLAKRLIQSRFAITLD